ncbi:tRNA (cytidine(34)-2'-O)-methyltransferase [Maritalea myrionectae]|uniref:tRNA (cytidine(34)-2'-O)-methyltransferase n=1 Tax=Maritalea myrionectae TaxID=454601 RepID=A0A2R4MCX8_9HYPH|nr:tRNA (cytidine(34)-2'-O)-methyltransferase [Maritalea myrionectae]AVX03785.1 tRNA (cytidine(34)-2'-O)-methyltransferase [Maritalea myrionectae]
MPLSLALYQPDIPQNAGTLMRLGACLNIQVHLIHPTGFLFSQKAFRRAGMDYLDQVDLKEHNSFDAFNEWRQEQGKRLVLLTTKSSVRHADAQFTTNDILMVGRESAGVPDHVATASDLNVRIPMRQDTRSLNVAIAGAIVLSEAAQQTNLWADLT